MCTYLWYVQKVAKIDQNLGAHFGAFFQGFETFSKVSKIDQNVENDNIMIFHDFSTFPRFFKNLEKLVSITYLTKTLLIMINNFLIKLQKFSIRMIIWKILRNYRIASNAMSLMRHSSSDCDGSHKRDICSITSNKNRTTNNKGWLQGLRVFRIFWMRVVCCWIQCCSTFNGNSMHMKLQQTLGKLLQTLLHQISSNLWVYKLMLVCNLKALRSHRWWVLVRTFAIHFQNFFNIIACDSTRCCVEKIFLCHRWLFKFFSTTS